jgi:nucleoside diphosphate kinase
MAENKNLVKLISEGVEQAREQKIANEEIYSDSSAAIGKNQFLFFIKPEVLDAPAGVKIDDVLELILDKIQEFGLTVHNVKVLSASYLEEHNVIAQHYGVINSIAKDAVNNLSEGAKEKFSALYGVDVSACKVLGGLEVIEQYPAFNAFSLDYLWQNLENKKLAGGTYVEAIKVDNETLHVINGFHPRQLKHFTAAGRSIVVLTLSGDLDWRVARNEFIGATNPANAEEGSIRKSLLVKKDALGLAEVGQGTNGVHLSAGPVEALVELRRYNSDLSTPGGEKSYEDYRFGQALAAAFGGKIDQIVQNANVMVDGKTTSIFDLTEEKNSDEAIELLKGVL